MLRLLVLQWSPDARIQFDRTQIDVLIQLKPDLQKDSLFQDAWFDLRMADRPEIDCRDGTITNTLT